MVSIFDERYAKLNTAQKRAVDTTEGPVLVVAGPGSGKTELLSLRVGKILKQGNVSPHNILCLTFTDSGAINMRERLATLIGNDAYRVSIFTFHAFCNHLIARYPEYFWNATHFSQAGDIDKAEIFDTIFSSLPHGHPLGSYHPELGYSYKSGVENRIKEIKNYGLTPNEYRGVLEALSTEYDEVNKAFTSWPDRLSIKDLTPVESILEHLRTQRGTTAQYLATTLRQAITASEALGKTEPLGEWKKKHLAKDATKLVLKDALDQEKILAVAELYERYQNELYRRGLYDYEDTILEVLHVLRDDAVLRNELEEQYQYILIDEFQDTNEAQMSLVRTITMNPIHEGRPNVCVVGDDDQAVYKFQGADISNIIEFRDKGYRDVETIVLDKNYRSTTPILALARAVITQGVGRLENKYKDIVKVLSSENGNLPKGALTIKTYTSDVAEYAGVARAVREAIKNGTDPSDIAIISRKHSALRALLPYLDREDTPYEYIKRSNVFDEPHIKVLIDMCAYVSSVLDSTPTADHILPRLLAYPCFHIDRLALFTIATEAKTKHIPWSTAIVESKDARVRALGSLLAELSIESKTTPLEHILEAFMEKSGFKDFYFSRTTIKNSPTTYVSFLASLKTFIETLRAWKEGEPLFVSDVAPFVATHKDHDVPLVSESPFMKNAHSIQLMTVHRSKGLEFGTVFIIDASDDTWTKGGRGNPAPLPLPLLLLMQPAGDTEDDFIRLFYVAMTRAKHTLHISSHKLLLRYLPQKDTSEDEGDTVPLEAHENALSLLKAPYHEDEWALLKRLVTDYRMPVTHMNNFLDVSAGGPLYFIEQNLLRFPQPMNASSAYGTAIHKALEEHIAYPRYHNGENAPREHIVNIFTKELNRARLSRTEHDKQQARGEKVLTRLIDLTQDAFLPDDKIEVDMKDEGVMLGDAHITGKLDLLSTRKGAYDVIDFKTSKAVGWDSAKSDIEKIKLHKYRNQLMVYKLLLEHSTHYRDKPVGTVALWFVEEDPIVELKLDADDTEIERTKKLIEAVYKKIISLDFPDISKYDKTYKGLLQFEDDLIEGRV